MHPVHAPAHEPPQLIVGVADLKVSAQPNAIITIFALGSCLGVACDDPVKALGGLLHAMPPDSKTCDQPEAGAAMFLDAGVPGQLASQLWLSCSRTTKRLSFA